MISTWFESAPKLVDVAMGRSPADLVVRNVRWVNVHSGEIIPNTDIAIVAGRFAYCGPDASHCIGDVTVEENPEFEEGTTMAELSEAGKIISVKMDKRVQRVGDQEIPQYQYAFILFEKVSDAQTAIRKFDNSNIFGSRPLKVELWLSKDEIEQQRKAKENREVHQILNQIIKGVGQMGVGPQTQPGQPY